MGKDTFQPPTAILALLTSSLPSALLASVLNTVSLPRAPLPPVSLMVVILTVLVTLREFANAIKTLRTVIGRILTAILAINTIVATNVMYTVPMVLVRGMELVCVPKMEMEL